ncbi:MAG: site-specific DNA-methyltransferase [Candidatus Omnitrophica bacterium]|nr:site-specific DNA-methyltransferase [Candidatus Omnitrophota bacterium]
MAKDYSKIEKNDLLKIIEKLESRKKYGIVWDEEKTKEQFEKESENALPVLREVKGKEIKTDIKKPTNILIEGDNYHALSVLNYTHQRKIDVIYIDPPYNTGNKDFKYNDDYVDKEDAYRHSKWLSFMSKRLRLAKNLLKDDGVIFISIDDNEIAQLKLLCDEIFGEQNFVSPIIWRRKTGASDAKGIATITEYILVYCKNNLVERWRDIFSQNYDSYNIERYKYKDEFFKERGAYYIDNLDRGGLRYSDSLNYAIKTPNGKMTFPNGRTKFKNDGWTWKWGKEKIKWAEENGYLEFRKSKTKASGWSVCYKNYMFADNEGNAIERGAPFKNLITEVINSSGTKELKEMGINFSNPKPTALIQMIIEMIRSKSIICLDFFAGSGTTGHAILKLNKQKDGSNRQFILCTNNEENICIDACYPRIQKAIKGYKIPKGEGIEGLGGNLKYFKTSFVKKSISRDDLKIRITRECTEMLCLREGIFEEKRKEQDYRIFEQNGHIMAIYYALEHEGLSELKRNLDNMVGEKTLYCFTLDPLGLDKEDFANWKNVKLEPIPQKILDIYEQIYEY